MFLSFYTRQMSFYDFEEEGKPVLITIHLFGQFVRFSQGNSNCQTNEW